METKGQVSATLTTSNIKELFKTMMQEFQPDVRKANSKPLTSQGTDDFGKKITYFWSHGITKNLLHHIKSCKRQKEGQKEESTLQNKMNGYTARYKPCN